MKIIYMEATLRLIASISPMAVETIEKSGILKQTELTRYIVIEDGTDL
jgi:hypothetical protein